MLKLIRLKVTYRDLARWQAFADRRRVGLLAMIKECVDEAIVRASPSNECTARPLR